MKFFFFIVRANYPNAKTKYYVLNDFTETLAEAKEAIIKNMNDVFENWEGLKLKRVENENGELMMKF